MKTIHVTSCFARLRLVLYNEATKTIGQTWWRFKAVVNFLCVLDPVNVSRTFSFFINRFIVVSVRARGKSNG